MTSDSPAPPNSDEQVGFYNDLWLRQWRDMITYNPTTRQLERQIHHALLDSGGFQTLLDVGCGNGMNIAAVRRDFPDATLVGADLSPEILALARQNVGPDPGIEFEVLDLAGDPLSRSFDVVLCNQVLEHIEDDRLAMQNLAAMCKGTMIIAVPGGRYNSTSRILGHHRHYSRDALVRLAEDAGIEVISARNWGFPFHSLYKSVLGMLPVEMQRGVGFGEYGLGKKLLARFIYLLHFGNVFNAGANVILVGRQPGRAQAE